MCQQFMGTTTFPCITSVVRARVRKEESESPVPLSGIEGETLVGRTLGSITLLPIHYIVGLANAPHGLLTSLHI